MELLFMEPVFKEAIWGGTKLRDVFGYEIPSDTTGECWAVSAHKNGDCRIAEMCIRDRDMAAEQKARSTYDNILRVVTDPDVCDPIRYLREREIVHFQRFGEALRITQDNLDSKNFYAFNPSFDVKNRCV